MSADELRNEWRSLERVQPRRKKIILKMEPDVISAGSVCEYSSDSSYEEWRKKEQAKKARAKALRIAERERRRLEWEELRRRRRR